MSTAPAPFASNPVPNWFDYSYLYERLVEEAPPNSWLVEIGVFHGASLRHLAHHAKAADKNLTVVGIDWGRGSGEHASHMEGLPGKNLAGKMMETIITAGVADDCTIILAPSVKAAKFIPDGACHMVFIDGDHSMLGAMADIKAYLPKVRPGGVMAGHDYFTFGGVRTAVHQVFGDKDWMARDSNSCWEVRL
jgi:cephalosporin hydroxylase